MDFDTFKGGIGQRLKQFIKSHNYNQKEFCKVVDIKEGALSAVTNGGGVSSDLIYKITIQFPDFDWTWLFGGKEKMENNANVLVGENNGTMHVQSIPNAEILLERLKALEKEVEGLKEQIKLKDQIIELLKGKT